MNVRMIDDGPPVLDGYSRRLRLILPCGFTYDLVPVSVNFDGIQTERVYEVAEPLEPWRSSAPQGAASVRVGSPRREEVDWPVSIAEIGQWWDKRAGSPESPVISV